MIIDRLTTDPDTYGAPSKDELVREWAAERSLDVSTDEAYGDVEDAYDAWDATTPPWY